MNTPDDDMIRAIVDALKTIEEISKLEPPGQTPGLYECYKLIGRINAIAKIGLASYDRLDDQ